jgi:hypothetical protein
MMSEPHIVLSRLEQIERFAVAATLKKMPQLRIYLRG